MTTARWRGGSSCRAVTKAREIDSLDSYRLYRLDENNKIRTEHVIFYAAGN
jgi:hypothetical protein